MASNKRSLQAYVRYDGNGRIIPGSLILNRFKPAVGNWQETPAYECCNYTPTPLPSNCIEFVVNTTIDTFFIFNASSLTQNYTYTVTWGDGSRDSGSSDEGSIQPEHTYDNANTSYTVRVCFSDASVINNLDFPGFD